MKRKKNVKNLFFGFGAFQEEELPGLNQRTNRKHNFKLLIVLE